jgi:hypothetical protein
MGVRDRIAALRRRTDLLWPVVAVAVTLIAIRLALPYIVKDYVNGRLHALAAYDGHVGDIDIGLWRGAYRIDGIAIEKRGGEKQRTPFFDGEHVDFSVEWHSLLHGKLVAEAHFMRPTLNMVSGPTESQSQTGSEEDWHQRLEELFPFRFNTVAVHDGTITFTTPDIGFGDALTAKHVEGIITNITNVVKTGKDNFADFRITGDVLGKAKAAVYGTAEPFTKNAKFDLNLSLEHVQMPTINPWLREYLKADAERGDFDLYLEVASANGHYEGFAKPILQNVQFLSAEDKPVKKPLSTLWSAVVQLAAELFENQPHKQIAARVPFHGRLQGTTNTDMLPAIASVLRNAFVGAFAHSIENRISMKDVEGKGETSRE